MNGASFLRNAAAFLVLRSISYSALSTPNRTVSSAGPPSRSSSSSTVIFCAILASWLRWGYLHRTRSTVLAAGTEAPPSTSTDALARHSAIKRHGDSPRREPGVPIANEDRLVVPDTLGTKIKLSFLEGPARLAPTDYSQRGRDAATYI